MSFLIIVRPAKAACSVGGSPTRVIVREDAILEERSRDGATVSRSSPPAHHRRQKLSVPGNSRQLAVILPEAGFRHVQRWETEVMTPIDKKLEKEVKEGKIPKPIEDLPSEWAKEDREIEGG